MLNLKDKIVSFISKYLEGKVKKDFQMYDFSPERPRYLHPQGLGIKPDYFTTFKILTKTAEFRLFVLTISCIFMWRSVTKEWHEKKIEQFKQEILLEKTNRAYLQHEE